MKTNHVFFINIFNTDTPIVNDKKLLQFSWTVLSYFFLDLRPSFHGMHYRKKNTISVGKKINPFFVWYEVVIL